jgi:mannosylglucosylglycerate synthase
VAREAVLLSYRLGGTDGVSVEAAKWEWALQSLGFSVRRVAGELSDAPRPDDVLLPAYSIAAPDGAIADPAVLAAALGRADLVIAENICSLPLNADAAHAAGAALADHRGRVVLHHYDLPWQRPLLADASSVPRPVPGSLHVVINDRSQRELADRGIRARTIRNAFDFGAPAGDRDATRAQLGFAPPDLVVLQPTRAILRKNVPGGLRFAEALAGRLSARRVVYWLTGPAEDGYGTTLTHELEATPLSVTMGRAARAADAYAAADVVVFPSTWEGFGNPVIESVVARRPLVVHRYPILDEIVSAGIRVFSVDDPDELAAWLAAPDAALLESNREIARRHFSLTDLPARLEAAFAEHGWSSW